MVAMAISWLLLSLHADSAQDYIFGCFFLICTSSLLKIRWLLGTLALTLPLLLVYTGPLWNPAMIAVLPPDASVHLTVAWATGTLMSFVADSYRRWDCTHLLLCDERQTRRAVGQKRCSQHWHGCASPEASLPALHKNLFSSCWNSCCEACSQHSSLC